MSYKITKSETKKIGTIKLPKGVWLSKVENGIIVKVNPNIHSYINRLVLFNNIRNCLSNYCPTIHMKDDFIQLGKITASIIKIDYIGTNSDCTNEWTFYEKVEDTVKVKPNTPEETWTETAYTFAKGENKFTIHGCIDDSWLNK